MNVLKSLTCQRVFFIALILFNTYILFWNIDRMESIPVSLILQCIPFNSSLKSRKYTFKKELTNFNIMIMRIEFCGKRLGRFLLERFVLIYGQYTFRICLLFLSKDKNHFFRHFGRAENLGKGWKPYFNP